MQIQIASNSALLKAAMIVVIGLLLLIPVSLLRGLVNERAAQRVEAAQQVARGWGGYQTVGGPLLVIPVSGADPARPGIRNVFVVAQSLTIATRLTVEKEPRRIGMYDVPVFVANVHLTGEFDLPAALASLRTEYPELTPHAERARLVIPVGDLQGVRAVKETDSSLTATALEPARDLSGAALSGWLRSDSGIAEGKQRFAFELTVAGTEALDFLPLGQTAEVTVKSNWPHPGLTRGLLPIERRITDTGFEARWQTLAVNRGVPKYWLDEDGKGERAPVLLPSLSLRAGSLGPTGESFGVQIVQPVDLYARVERTVKYAGLFISMSLLALFLWEHVARRRVHPVQYGLLGLALSIFYLLLLALAEHLGFGPAYGLAAVALCTLLGAYLAGGFDSIAAGSAASAAFGVIYGLLFLIVTAEDYALLAGALSLFALLAAAMLLTRRVDWYRVGAADG